MKPILKPVPDTHSPNVTFNIAFSFDKRTNEVKGMIKIPEPAKESVIDQLYYYGKAAWKNQKSEPNDFHLFIADWKCQPEIFIKDWQELIFYLTNQENKLY